jgi:1-acyl-sn-glycerol-3-phosphate acyltransferase
MYLLVKLLTHFTIWLTCKRFSVYNKSVTAIETPIVLGCNHPNSFLDAILVGSLMKNRVHFLTRGDVFNREWVRRLLKTVNMIPIYRIRDGKENLTKNDHTFEACRKILLQGEDVLIFVEGFCNYQTSLQTPLKKGAPRLLIQGWKDGVEVQLLPVWLRYNSFSAFPKEVEISFGKPFGRELINSNEEDSFVMQNINKETARQLLELAAVEHSKNKSKKNMLLLLPALLAMITHFLFYVPVQQLAVRLKGSIHYDSILFVLIAFLYPVYLLLISGIVFCTMGWAAAAGAILLLPLLARAYILWK